MERMVILVVFRYVVIPAPSMLWGKLMVVKGIDFALMIAQPPALL